MVNYYEEILDTNDFHRYNTTMKNKCGLVLSSVLLSLLIAVSSVFAIEVAPKISDMEIVERLTRVEEGIKTLQQQIADTNKRIEGIK